MLLNDVHSWTFGNEMSSFEVGDIPFIISEFADSTVAFKRISEVINCEELSETFTIDPNAKYAISVKDGNFTWENNDSKVSTSKNESFSGSGDESSTIVENTPLNEKDIVDGIEDITDEDKDQKDRHSYVSSNKPFTIKNINLNIPRNSLTAIVGSVGSGKSSLVNALIGEMKCESGDITYSGSIGYCPQQAWIQNATIKDNILFGKEYDKEKYKKVIKSCALTSDLKMFPNGDMTEIGERGINLSGGQKQRISLAAGGVTCVLFVSFFLIFSELTKIGNDLWLTFWTDNKFNFSVLKYVIIYLGWSVLQAIAKALFSIIITYAGINAAKKIHRNAIKRVISAPISFFDTTPLGRIINRFSKDQDSVDNVLTETIQSFISCFAVTISTLIIIIYTTPMFIIPLVPLLFVYYIMQEYYRSTSREIKRLDSLSRSPLYANFNETMNGLSTIRAYREQNRFIEVNGQLLDNNNRPCILQITAQRWLSIRLEMIGALLVFFAAASGILLKKSISPSLLGLSLSYSLNVTGYLNYVVREFSETEIHMNAIERLSHYTNDIEIENQDGYDVPKEWPKNGKIEIKNLTMRYASHLPPVLNNVSFNIQGNEKIGVVGRTGAGKSSIVMTLFRLVEPDVGPSIKIDDISVMDIKLNDLRKRIFIIPQDPILFSGTIRFNMDPFDEHTNQEIWTALENAGLKDMINGLEKKLESEVKCNGENFSVGQRQLLCLARAMIRKNRILIMDEATASVDAKLDAIIQKALRTEFKDVTVITIAHRLNTIIDYDKILVLNQGNISEYDKPSHLLFETLSDGSLVPTNKTEFSKLVDETGPVNAELLRKLALSS